MLPSVFTLTHHSRRCSFNVRSTQLPCQHHDSQSASACGFVREVEPTLRNNGKKVVCFTPPRWCHKNSTCTLCRRTLRECSLVFFKGVANAHFFRGHGETEVLVTRNIRSPNAVSFHPHQLHGCSDTPCNRLGLFQCVDNGGNGYLCWPRRFRFV